MTNKQLRETFVEAKLWVKLRLEILNEHTVRASDKIEIDATNVNIEANQHYPDKS